MISASSSLHNDACAPIPLVTECILSSAAKTFRPLKALVNTGATGYGFIDEKVAQQVCTALGIEPLPLLKPKPIRGYDGQFSKRPITHAIYPSLKVQDHTERTAPLLITTLGQHPVILGKTWLNTHGVVIDMHEDRLICGPQAGRTHRRAEPHCWRRMLPDPSSGLRIDRRWQLVPDLELVAIGIGCEQIRRARYELALLFNGPKHVTVEFHQNLYYKLW